MSETSKLSQEVDCKVYEGIVKMWIVDVLNSPANHPTQPDVIMFHSTYVKKVNIFGIVTECHQVGCKTQFRLDDATGSIMCSFNYEKFVEKAKERERVEDRLKTICRSNVAERKVAQALAEILDVTNKRSPSQCDFRVGDCIALGGFVSNFFSDRRINGFLISKPLTETQAAQQITVMATIYKDLYSKKEQETSELKRKFPIKC